MKVDPDYKKLEQRLSTIERELARVKGESGEAELLSSSRRFKIRAHFGRVALERKPYVVSVGGITQVTCTLTPIRTAIMLVLLMDLMERGDFADSKLDISERVRGVLDRLAPEESSKTTPEAIRVALYRAGQFINEEFGSKDEEFTLSADKGQLSVRDLHGRPVAAEQIDLDITTSDQTISAILDQTLATSPLSRLRKSRTLFVPGGNDGQDRLILELLSQPHPINQSTIFYRPTIQSFAPALLNRLVSAPRRIERQKAALSKYQQGTLTYTEILPRKTLWEMIRRTPGKGFAMFQGRVGVADLVQQLDHFKFLLTSFPTYELVLTDAFIPFYITTFEIIKPDGSERYVMFFQSQEEGNISKVSVFAQNDDNVYFATHEKIVNWVLNQPTTVRSKEQVLLELEAVRETLIAENENVESLSPRGFDPLSLS